MKYSVAAQWRLFTRNKVGAVGRNCGISFLRALGSTKLPPWSIPRNSNLHQSRPLYTSINSTKCLSQKEYSRVNPLCLYKKRTCAILVGKDHALHSLQFSSSVTTTTRNEILNPHRFSVTHSWVRKYCDNKDSKYSGISAGIDELCLSDFGVDSKTRHKDEKHCRSDQKFGNKQREDFTQNEDVCSETIDEKDSNYVLPQRDSNWQKLEANLNKADVRDILFAFYYSKEVKQAARKMGLRGNLLLKSMRSFRKYAVSESRMNKHLQQTLKRIHMGEEKEESLLPFLVSHTKQLFPGFAQEEELRKISDLSGPADLFTQARKIQRKIVYHVGPTNSGKTHAALERFRSSQSGIYCAPLRLLAAEVFRKTNNLGVKCDLVTGEERQYAVSADEPARHVACTVEMCNTFSSFNCAVIDEIQMVGDRDRGWAWTRAFLGLICPEVHVCGEETTIDLVCRLAEACGDKVEICRYDRLTPLKVLNYSLGDFSQVKPGDCVVAFSQKQLFRIRHSIEQLSGYKCAIVYGGLPPATRTEQARQFNDRNDEHCVMVASDAIGMGLNLNIKRLIFSTLEKFDGQSMVQLSVSQTKQIAGRAGRFGTEHSVGEVTTFHREDLGTLKELLKLPSETVTTAGITPFLEQIQLLSHQLPNSTLSTLFDVFTTMAQLDGDCYFMCDLGEKKFLAEVTDSIPLSIRDQYTFCQAPISVSSKPIVLSLARKFAWHVSRAEELSGESFEALIPWPPFRPRSLSHLQELGALHEVFDIYLWLSYRFEHIFVDYEGVQAMQQHLESIIGKAVSSNLGSRSKHFSSGEPLYRSKPGSRHDPSRSKRSVPATGQRSAWLKQPPGERMNKHDRRMLKNKNLCNQPKMVVDQKSSVRQQQFHNKTGKWYKKNRKSR